MLGGLFLPWISGPLGTGTVPWDAIRQLDSDLIEQVLRELPPEGMALVATFVLAALLVLLGLFGAAARAMAFATGALTVGLVGWSLFQATQAGEASPVPLSGGDLSQLLQELAQYIRPGAWMWAGGGTLLLLLSLFAPNRR